MTSTELARKLSDAALKVGASRDPQALAELEALARDATAHVRRVGDGSVDHIVLNSMLKPLVDEFSSLDAVLLLAGWRWIR
ncbi:MAG: hypothetical protein ACT4TC_15975 [Myxococcaceae bacterium]